MSELNKARIQVDAGTLSRENQIKSGIVARNTIPISDEFIALNKKRERG